MTELRRENGAFPSPATGGKGWICLARDGGCGALYPRDAPEVLQQLAPHARAALADELERTRSSHRKQAAEEGRAAQLAQEFLDSPEPVPPGEALVLWDALSSQLRERLPPASWATWLRPVTALSCEGGQLALLVPNERFRAWISGNYAGHLAAAAAALDRAHQVTLHTAGELTLRRFTAWAHERKLPGLLRLAVLREVGRRVELPDDAEPAGGAAVAR